MDHRHKPNPVVNDGESDRAKLVGSSVIYLSPRGYGKLEKAFGVLLR